MPGASLLERMMQCEPGPEIRAHRVTHFCTLHVPCRVVRIMVNE